MSSLIPVNTSQCSVLSITDLLLFHHHHQFEMCGFPDITWVLETDEETSGIPKLITWKQQQKNGLKNWTMTSLDTEGKDYPMGMVKCLNCHGNDVEKYFMCGLMALYCPYKKFSETLHDISLYLVHLLCDYHE
jgi:hypothetical protein